MLGFSDLRGVSSWCSRVQGVTLQWLTKVKIIGDKKRSRNLKEKSGLYEWTLKFSRKVAEVVE